VANFNANGPKFTINSQTAYIINNASTELVGTFAVMLVSNSFSGSITVKSRIMSNLAAAETSVPVCYVARYLNGAIGTDATVSTAITGTSLIMIPASGQAITLDCTSFVSGTMTAYAIPLLGVA
jgi:hypothetical protein